MTGVVEHQPSSANKPQSNPSQPTQLDQNQDPESGLLPRTNSNINESSSELRLGLGDTQRRRDSVLRRLKKFLSLNHLVGSSSMMWFCPAYVFDWGVGLAAVIIAKLYLEPIKPYRRDFSIYYDDKDYHWPLRKEQIPDNWLHHFAVTLPLVILIFLTLVAHPTGGIYLLPTLHHSLLGLLTSHALSIIPTDLLKVWVGALRPDFFNRCSYSSSTNDCKPHFHSEALMDNGMRSFPSGHSSTAFAGLGFLAIWIAGRNGGFAFGGDGLRFSGPLQSRLLKASVALVWLFFALWIALTRIQDHRHHPRDVIVGSLIGLTSAVISYLWYFPSPFNGRLLRSSMGKPRLVYDHELINLNDTRSGALTEGESLIPEVDRNAE